MKRTYKAIAGVAAVLSLALAATVYAHPGGGMGPGSGMGPGHGMGPGMGMGMGRGMGAADMTAAASARMAQLKAELKITSAQETAWKAYEAAVTQQAAAMQAMRTQMQSLMHNAQPGTTAPDWAAQRDAMFKQREAGQQAHTAAVKALYSVLTPEQRAIADRDMGPMGGYRMGGWHRMR
ncbi:MAG: Spy/CpxP family protein refolding chaperone [Ramlibacter sp.]|nr:Spy/CpxP family protein refolding chaperone [Ramlibacter sp.]